MGIIIGYHGTSMNRFDSILKLGLLPSNKINFSPYNGSHMDKHKI